MRCIVLLSAILACRSDTEKTPVAPVDDATIETIDADGDGFFSDEDCDDSNAQVNPSADEVCDGVDNNCNTQIDEGATNLYYQDADADGYGDLQVTIEACERPIGTVENPDDCDDTDDTISPSNFEECGDGIDNNCDGNFDEAGALGSTAWYFDGDLDGYGSGTAVLACVGNVDYVSNNLDCDDADGLVSPVASEVCDGGIDNDCNGLSDDMDGGVTNGSVWYLDYDQDGEGGSQYSMIGCLAPSGYVVGNVDCDDANASVNSTALEVCDGVDNDCDGLTDDDDTTVLYQTSDVVYSDLDGDGFGDSSALALACMPSLN